jgi:hypothetical protein
MPRVYNSPSPSTLKKNASKKYRAAHTGVTLKQADQEGIIPKDTMAPLAVLSPAEAMDRLLRDDHSAPYDDTFTSRQVALLQAYVGFPTDPVAGALTICQSVGYAPAGLEQAQMLLKGVIDRVTSLDDLRRAMRLSGMGEMWFLRRMFQLLQCGSPRVEANVLKLAGLALGAFDDPSPASGAKIIIERAEASPDGTRTIERTTVEGTGVVISSDGSLAFPTSAAPKGGQQVNKRRKLLNNMESS